MIFFISCSFHSGSREWEKTLKTDLSLHHRLSAAGGLNRDSRCEAGRQLIPVFPTEKR